MRIKDTSQKAAEVDRPNIILFITDQQRYDTIAALGYSYADTPNLDRIVNQGVSFGRCYVTAPSCAPSRASLFTGLYCHTNGVFVNNRDAWRHTWIERLADAGYRCVNVGKMHTSPWDTPAGFHERYVVENKDRFRFDRWFIDEWDKALRIRGYEKPSRATYGKWPDWEERLGAYEWRLPADLHPDNFVGDFAAWWLDRQKARWWNNEGQTDKPIFLQVGFPGPHPPYDPVPEYAKRYVDKDLPIIDPTEESLEEQPEVMKKLREYMMKNNPDSIRHLANPTPQQRLRQRAYYLANVSMIDAQVGQVLDALERNGYLENAVVVFTSDHGDSLGDHGHSQKWNMYEEVVRVPLLFWRPGHYGPNICVNELVQHFDIAPTILEIAGVAVPEWFEASSLLPFLEGDPASQGREVVFSEHGRDKPLADIDFMTMVRRSRWKLVHFAGDKEGQLFDLDEDPFEFRNLWDDPESSSVKRLLLDDLREWLISSNVRTHTWRANSR